MACVRVLSILAILTLAACAPKMYITGHLDDYSEVYTGDGVGGENSFFNFSGVYTGVNCSTSGARTITPFALSKNDLNCSDGRTSVVSNTPYKGLFFWNSVGTFSDGRVIRLYMSTARQEIDEYLQKFKATAEARSGAIKQAATPSPPPALTAKGPKTVASLPVQKPLTSADFKFTIGPRRPDDIAVIIGNADYGAAGKDIPDVVPAHADAAGFKKYATDALGILDGNIIDLSNASQADLISVFGSREQYKGRLYNWVKPGSSNVTVYYSGHGAPAGDTGSAYLIPVNANPATIELNGYPLDILYANLAKLPAKSTTVVLEACFSGAAEGGAVVSNASPVFMKVKSPTVPKNITVISAGGPQQMASWEQDKSHGLFTKYYLLGMSGEADAAPYGNGDGAVGYDELKRYLDGTMTYYARRYYGRDQNAQIVMGR